MLMNSFSRRSLLYVLIALLGLGGNTAFSQAQGENKTALEKKYVYPRETWERTADPGAVGYSGAALEKLKEYMKTLKTTGLMVVVGGRVLFEYGDIKQLSYIASVRKSILAMLYGKYVENGTIRLDKTLKELGMTDHGGLLPIEQKATIRHLISARSGIYHNASNGGDSSAKAPWRGSKNPGSYFLYNNWDFNAAGAIFENETGKDIYDALETDIAQPIGMQDFDRSLQKKTGNLKRSKYPAYHMWLSTRDMARFGYLMLREGNWAGKQLVPVDWVKKIVSIITPTAEMNPARLKKSSFGYGYMWWVWEKQEPHGFFKGAYTGMGSYGQFITVIPLLDMVIAHKTYAPPDGVVGWGQYKGIIDRLIAARIN